MDKFGCIVLVCLILGVSQIISKPVSQSDNKNQAGTNLRKFSYNLLDVNILEAYGDAKGATASSPFGVGYMLANLNTNVYNISTTGFERLFELPGEQISDQYAILLDQLKQGQFSTKNLLYLRSENNSVELSPEATRQLKTERVYTDWVNDWKNSWHLMNGMIANQSNGKLDDQFIAKGGLFGGSFFPFTAGAYINTNYLKAAWHKSWTSVGHKTFADDERSLPYYQVEGKYTTLENDKYSVVLIPIKNSNTDMSAIFMLPKGNLTQLTKEDLASFFKIDSANSAKWNTTNKIVQVPSFHITLLNQHYKGLEEIGINETFCGGNDDVRRVKRDVAKGKNASLARGLYYANPIAQVSYIDISPDFVEMASATGMSITSVEKLMEYREGRSGEESNNKTRSDVAAAAAAGKDKIVAGVLGASKSPNNGGSKERQAAKGGNTSKISSSGTTTKKTEENANVLVFDKPFIWIIHDSNLGTLYYGSIISLDKYKQEREPPEGFEWLLDTEKSFVWNCP